MPKRRWSIAFGRWFKRHRTRVEKTQADFDGVSQQTISLIEHEGVAPDGNDLPGLIAGLSKSETEVAELLAEARGILAATTTQDFLVRQRELDFLDFKEKLAERAKHEASQHGGELTVFLLREDPQPVDRFSIAEFQSILDTPSIVVALLFSTPDRQVWESFNWISETLTERNKDKCFRDRFRGYYLRESHTGPPLAHPFALIADSGGVELYSYGFDARSYREQIESGMPEAEARQRALLMQQCLPAEMSRKYANWIGFRRLYTPDLARWNRISEHTDDDAPH